MHYNPNIYNKPFETYKIKLGTVYFYEHFLLAEFNEGVDVTFRNFDELAFLVKTHYEDKPIGFISNRINSYSINVNDAKNFNDTFSNLKAFATISYSNLTERIIEIENHFFKFNRKVFNDFNTAINWVEDTLSLEDPDSYNK
ncbi:hypothetical protein KO504_02755 [Winogradskyella psychrotolerans]|uniref:hypothetical protein n=1 Tax=Winogradskyella psychrotolerans TaxID=1344585 RepID=UPI001C076E6D|nr:hypothetical protein [Winogradskyella psychrotolerans]MBU2920246.1 hypothetical protein [Winogradskyella psychrotolerans]